MTMQYPFILPCPICGETPQAFKFIGGNTYRAICPNCSFDFGDADCGEPARIWNTSVIKWFEKNIPPKECPSCGSTRENENIYILRTYEGYRVRCGTCRYMGIAEKTIPAALILWNKQQEPENVTTQDKE